MEQFRVLPEAAKELKKKMFFRTLPITLISAGVGLYISGFASEDYYDNIFTILLPAVVVIVMVSYGAYRSWRTQKTFLETYTLTFTDKEITREAKNLPVITIHLFEVNGITKDRNGNLFVQGKDRANTIGIPAKIENYERVETLLEQIQPITGLSFLMKYRQVLALSVIGLMICLYTVSNKIIIGISGVLLTVALIWSFYELQTNKNVTKSAKSMSWLRLVFVLFVIYTTVTKVFDIGF